MGRVFPILGVRILMSTIQKLYSHRNCLPSPFDKNVLFKGPLSGDKLGKSQDAIGD
jgi:hypothetical protein